MCIIFREHYLLLHILIVRAAPPLLQAVLDQDKPRIKELLKGLKRSGGAGEQQIFGGHGHQGVAVKTVKIKD